MKDRSGRIIAVLGVCCWLGLLGNDGCDTSDSEVPLANAGDDQVIQLGQQASLDGGLSEDPAGGDLLYHWELESKPVTSAVTSELFPMNHESGGASTSFVPDVPGTYGISLYVETDLGDESDLDYVVVVAGSTNTLPIADAGDDVVVAVGDVAYLDGSLSSDPEGAEITYEWSFDLLPAGSLLDEEEDLFNQGAPVSAIIPDVEGQFVLRLRVYDGEFWSAPDFVTVSGVESNQLPVADAGLSWELSPCSDAVVEFDGGASYDYEGSDLTYFWEVVSVPVGSAVSTATLDDADTATPSFIWDEIGLYTLRLVVNDGQLDSEPDYVAVRSVPTEPNTGPVADAGGNITYESSSFCQNNTCSTCGGPQIILDATQSWDPEHDALDYTWTITSGTGTINGEHAEQGELQMESLTPSGVGDTEITVVGVELAVEDCQGPAFGDTQEIIVYFSCTGISW